MQYMIKIMQCQKKHCEYIKKSECSTRAGLTAAGSDEALDIVALFPLTHKDGFTILAAPQRRGLTDDTWTFFQA
jgi:hypothetical protein